MLSHCPSFPANARYLSVSVVRHPVVKEVVGRFGLSQETDDLIHLLSLFQGIYQHGAELLCVEPHKLWIVKIHSTHSAI